MEGDWEQEVLQALTKSRHRDGAEVTLSGRVFQMFGPETEKARPLTVDSLTDGTCRRLETSGPRGGVAA